MTGETVADGASQGLFRCDVGPPWSLPPPEPAARQTESAAPPAQSLVLIVGPALRPDAAFSQVLARDGMRQLWLGSLEQAVQAPRLAVFDATVVEAGLCDRAGLSSLARLRAALNCPLLLVAEQADEVDEIVALEMGADAYLVQPVTPRRLRAHLRALLRRTLGADAESTAAAGRSRFDGWTLECASGVLHGHGRRIELTDVQARLMQGLMDAAGMAVPRTALVAALPRGAVLAARSVDVYVSRLRLRLEHEGVQRLRVQMVRGCGYALQGLGAVVADAAPRVAPQQRAVPAAEAA